LINIYTFVHTHFIEDSSWKIVRKINYKLCHSLPLVQFNFAAGWLAGWLALLLVWLAWLAGWLVGWLAWLAGLSGWLVAGWLAVCEAGWVMASWLAGSQIRERRHGGSH
jgi:hypothetical protein